MMYLLLLITTVSIVSLFYLIILTIVEIIETARYIRNHSDEIKFLHEDDQMHGEEFIVCTLPINETRFYEWRMTTTGNILKYSIFKFKFKNKIDVKARQWGKEYLMIIGPGNKRVNHQYFGDKNSYWNNHTIIRLFSLNGLMGFLLDRYLKEPFMIAKMIGFEKYNYMDYI